MLLLNNKADLSILNNNHKSPAIFATPAVLKLLNLRERAPDLALK